jgi:hypothetical protein
MRIMEERARLRGAQCLVGDVLRSNQPMLVLAHALGFTQTRPLADARVVRVSKPFSRFDASGRAGLREMPAAA